MSEAVITRLSSTVNAAVVQLPERRLPGVVLQADSLENLAALLDEVASRTQQGDSEEALGVLAEAREIISGYLASYHQAVDSAVKP